ncbi:hypothetical protein MNBD_NITROSPINAE03-1505 [hydrothermal vent metagenome]|uniref:Putative Se/S carrier protein-like domain-containing protein n=1 Tax=hydrothermal vent metagenome TaxID=652676 RepID=A0A3B1BXN8_9ZZZZ
MMSKKFIVVFISTHETMKAERAFKEGGAKVRTTTRPRAIDSNCQLALTFKEEEFAKIRQITEKQSLSGAGFFRQGEGGLWERLDIP